MIQQIAQSLYSGSPDELLYHYTTIGGLQGIVESQCLWASDVRYMNDSAELQYIIRLLRERNESTSSPIGEGSQDRSLLAQFIDWIEYRMTNGHMVFAASFRANGNLLSQWRGYSRIGKGVSIGFKGSDIQQLLTDKQFQLGRCIYRREDQIALIDRVLDSLSTMIKQFELENPDTEREYFFSLIEADMLRIAALLKHPSFAEEDEWRIVSPVITDYLSAPVKFREGKSMLIPYYEFPLSLQNEAIPIEHLFLGPTPNSALSLNSIRLYLRKQGIQLDKDITYCDIPYRNR